MNILSAEYKDGKLILGADASAMRFVYEFKAGEYEIVRQKKKRSIDANAYAWVLIDRISHALHLPKIDIYRNAIKDIGGVSETVCVREKAVDKLVEGWRHNGIGWQTEVMPSQIKNCKCVILYYGSSVYDSSQMSTLIDHLVQDAKALGIETLPPDRLDAMLGAWK